MMTGTHHAMRQERHAGNGPTPADGSKAKPYGRIVPLAQPICPPDEQEEKQLIEIAMKMAVPSPVVLGSHLPDAGYAYFGQFVDHDISENVTTLEDLKTPGTPNRNARSPALDLDHLYGLGPVEQPELYDADGQRFKLGWTEEVEMQWGAVWKSSLNDLPRHYVGDAHWNPILADSRSAQNLILAQLHVAFMKVHNFLLSAPEIEQAPYDPASSAFERARQCLRWHYQWLVMNDWLPKVTIPKTVETIFHAGAAFTLPGSDGESPVPLEGSIGGFRVGHTMIRERYFLQPAGGLISLPDLCTELVNRPIPADLVIDWDLFFRGGGGTKMNFTSTLDSCLVPPLGELGSLGLRGMMANLAARTLIRGAYSGLPSGQLLARNLRMKKDQILSSEQLLATSAGFLLKKYHLLRNTPLFYYVLAEAQHLGLNEYGKASTRLGPLGGALLAGTMFQILNADDTSYFKAELRGWEPFLFSKESERPLLDLIKYPEQNGSTPT